ncbi:U3 small nucleolar RNA-associated protein [Friedmanniomyces endolithicus]|uniref:U3 small nucleolar RNA-associated protein n=1 Tax=Friedmanniomyces endolithicus TaxID=329885 RepID=A0AAN6KVC6_9PEZI|nr:U3 small nucleolar RNA-associated protein [Friedmanniomyces endolithicus]KAK0981939.1 U3 small nucleolar RNA-associated protein [Friedmanniomyces endolithicus]KAK1003455.1 U3 small nucleolar RNA-associated protein [Friedmanniomyces endolithicus]
MDIRQHVGVSSTMDVHRARFVPYPTSAISALAFSRSSDSGYTGAFPALRLAVGRANGDIEIWNPLKGQWVQETVCLGDGKSVDGLAWTQDPDEVDSEGTVLPGQQRLFSIASSQAVTEWDLARSEPKRKSTGNFSEVWCFAAQPRWKTSKNAQDEPRSQDMVAGCGDGTLVLLSTADNDLQFKRFLARVAGKRARCMCITYQNRDVVVAGFADSMIRIYDTRNNSQVRQMSLGIGLPGAPKNAFVWTIKVLPNGDIVSGDSNGEVRIWDGRNHSLVQRLTGHDNDCLDLVTSADGHTILSGSIDGRMSIYRQTLGEGGRKSWAKHSHRRAHSGEVKAMAAFDSKNGLSVVVSGGSDAAPMLTPLREHGKENSRSLSSLPQQPKIVSARKARLIASWWEKEISIWRIARQAAIDDVPQPEKPRKLVAKLSLDVKQAIRSVSVSADGKLLAAVTASEIKVFQLRRRTDSDGLAVRKVHAPQEFTSLGARLLSFSADAKWLAVVTPDSEVHIARFAEDPEQPKQLRCLPHTIELDRRHSKRAPSSLSEYDRALVRVAFASDSSVLVAGDVSGYLDSWVLEGHEDLTATAVDITKHDSDKVSSNDGSDAESDSSDDDDDALVIFYGQHWTDNPAGHLLPKLDSAPLALTFRPTILTAQALTNGNPGVHSTRHNPHAHSHALPPGEHRLWIMTARHEMYELDVLAGRLSDWSRRNPTAALPEAFRQIKDRVMDAVWDVAGQHQRLWLHGTSWVFMLDVGGDSMDAESVALTKKRKRKARNGNGEERSAKRHQLGSGAGDRVESERSLGPQSLTRTENGHRANIDLTRSEQNADEDEDVEVDSDLPALQLARLRSNGSKGEVARRDQGTEGQRKWWCTFKYRPILGMVPLEDATIPEEDRMLEVAIVERPI